MSGNVCIYGHMLPLHTVCADGLSRLLSGADNKTTYGLHIHTDTHEHSLYSCAPGANFTLAIHESCRQRGAGGEMAGGFHALTRGSAA